MQPGMFAVGKMALEPVSSFVGQALGPVRAVSPLDKDVVFALRRALALGTAHKSEGSILPDDAHDCVLVYGVDALALQEHGRTDCRSALVHHLACDRVKLDGIAARATGQGRRRRNRPEQGLL